MYILKPIVHETIWGGSILKQYCDSESDRIGHLYSLYCRNDISNEILNGKYVSKTFNDVFHRIKRQYHMEQYDCFPLTLALVEAKDNLSIQVHPSDLTAEGLEGKKEGKRESWYFLEAPVTGYIYNGCTCSSVRQVQDRIEEQRLEEVTSRLSVARGDYVYVEPGTLHALTTGCLVYEIEEGSDFTYRFYDYNRKDENGKKRELHINSALQSIDVSLQSKVKRYELNGNEIAEERYITSKYDSINHYQNCSDTLECVTFLYGGGIADSVRIKKGMTVVLEPLEKLENLEESSVIIAKMRI